MAYFYPIENGNNTSNNSTDAAPTTSRGLAGMRHIGEKVLKLKLPETHDSVQDAQVALYLTVNVLVNGATSVPSKYSREQHTKEAKDMSCTLFVHRLPLTCKEEHLVRMLTATTSVVPKKILPILFNQDSGETGAMGKTTIVYTSEQHANLAFECIPGQVRNDNSQRPQKRIYLKGGGYICIRK